MFVDVRIANGYILGLTHSEVWIRLSLGVYLAVRTELNHLLKRSTSKYYASDLYLTKMYCIRSTLGLFVVRAFGWAMILTFLTPVCTLAFTFSYVFACWRRIASHRHPQNNPKILLTALNTYLCACFHLVRHINVSNLWSCKFRSRSWSTSFAVVSLGGKYQTL